MGNVATSPLPPGGSPPLQSGGQNQKWPTSGQGGYITPAVWGVPTASERGDRIRIGPQVGKVATSHLPPEESPPLQSGGTESELAHKWARWLHHPCRLGGHHRFRAGGRLRTGAQVGKVATSPLPPGGPHRFRAGGQNPKWPTSGQGGYITPAASGGPHRFRAGGQNHKGPTSGQGGYITPAAWGVPTASDRGDRIRSAPQVRKVATSPVPPGGSPPLQSGGTESEVAHKWARWLHHPCRLGGPHRFRAGRQNQRWPTSGHGGYITPAA